MDWNRIQDKSAQQDSFAGGVGRGAWDGGKAMVTDVADLGKAAYKVATDDEYREQAFAKASEIARATGEFGSRAAKDPIGAGESVWNQAKAAAGQARKAFVDARDAAEKEGRLNNFYGSLLGRGGFEIAAMFVPVSKLGLLGKGAKGASAVGKAAEGAGTVAKVARRSREAKRLAHRIKMAETKLRRKAKVRIGPVASCEKASTARLRALHEKHPHLIESTATFKPNGVKQKVVQEYLQGDDGKRYLDAVRKGAKPGTSENVILTRAYEQLMTGTDVPKAVRIREPLVKIVPEGQFKDYTPFWTTQKELDAAVASGKPLNEVFGLPMKSDAVTYKVYQATPPPGGAEVFVSKVAGTTELGGLEKRAGGARQYLRPDSTGWKMTDTGVSLKNIGGK